jgi:hypothetical protein
VQLELGFWPRWCVRRVIDDYLAMRGPALAAESLHNDYARRRAWLLEVLGEMTPAAEVSFDVLDGAARGATGVLKHVTIKRRLVFWRSAVRYAAIRGIVPKDAIPELPPWLVDDSIRSGTFLTLPQHYEFRLALPSGRYRKRADLSMWTGMHTVDLNTTQRWMLEPDYAWPGSDIVGRWWRRNTKNANPRKPIKIHPCWIVMEPELRELALEWLSEPGPPDKLLIGPCNNVNRTFEAAAARANLPRIRPNVDYRASHATLLMARGWSYEYVRIVLGHVGEVHGELVNGHLRARTAKRPSTLSAHYLRSNASPEHKHGQLSEPPQ